MNFPSSNLMVPYEGLESDLGFQNQLNAEQKASFGSGYQIFWLQTGMRLSRFLHNSRTSVFSQYWIDEQTTGDLYRAIQNVQNYTQSVKQEVIRKELAILNNWGNSLSIRVKIEIQAPTIAYVGSAGLQDFYSKEKEPTPFGEAFRRVERKIGGMIQYVIPSFYREMKVDNPQAKVVHITKL
jgi:hypothetical protein